MRVAILGAGAGGSAAAAELTQAGHDVNLWNRSAQTLQSFLRVGGVEYEGVLGEGLARPRLITADIEAALNGCDACVCTLPTFSHAPVARTLAQSSMHRAMPIVLNPGHTGGALEFRNAFRAVRNEDPVVAEFSTLTYVARKNQPQRVTVTGRARKVRVAALPAAQTAITVAQTLFPCAEEAQDILATSLANVNMVLHPPGAMLAAAWVEARAGDFTFYVDAMTPGVARVMKSLDDERRKVAAAFGHPLPNLIEEMQRIGTVEESVKDTADFAAAISGGVANSRIKAPGSFNHRYYLEDFGHGLLPFLELARIAQVDTPTAHALFSLEQQLTGIDHRTNGRTANAMGIAGLDRTALLQFVRAAKSA